MKATLMTLAALAALLVPVSARAEADTIATGEGGTFGFWAKDEKIQGTSEETKKKLAKFAEARKRRAAQLAAQGKKPARPPRPVRVPPLQAGLDLVRTGSCEKAVALFDASLTTGKPSREAQVVARTFRALAAANGDESALVGACRDVRAWSDTLGTNGESRVEADTRYSQLLGFVQKQVFRTWPDAKGRRLTRQIDALRQEMLHDETRVTYPVKFLSNAPATAEGAALRDIWNELPAENRFGLYRAFNPWREKTWLRLLKSAGPAPHLAADEPGFAGRFAACCDAEGLHIYCRFEDPEAADVRSGMSAGASFEFSIMSDPRTAPHWLSCSIGEPYKYWGVEWDTPHPGYRLTCDGIRTDAFAGDGFSAFHVFQPWTLDYANLPVDGKAWTLVLYAGAAKHAGSLGGGGGHEIGRGAKLVFNLAPEDAAAIRRGALRQAAGRYLSERRKWENAEFWSDPHLGDERFMPEVQKELDELDGVVKRIRTEPLSDSDVDALLSEYAFRLADFRLSLERRRAEFLNAEFFKED